MENVSETGLLDCSIKRAVAEVKTGFSSFAKPSRMIAYFSSKDKAINAALAFARLTEWNEDHIKERAQQLAAKAVQIWP